MSAIRTLRLGLGAEAESKAEWLSPWVDRRLLAPLCNLNPVAEEKDYVKGRENNEITFAREKKKH